MSPQDKPLAWLHGEVKTPPFSKAARIDAGYLLRQLQQGQTLPALSLRSSCGVSRKLAPELATKAMTKRGPSRLDLPEQLAKAIRQAWPSGIVHMADVDDAPFWDVYPKLKANLSRIPGTAAIYERESQVPQWGEASDQEADPTEWNEDSRSYHVLFLPLLDGRFQFQTDILEPDEDGVEQRFQGEGRIGCAVGISRVAPFAIVTLDQMEVFENGSSSEPDIEPHIFDLEGRELDMEEHYREMIGDEGVAILRKLRNDVAAIVNDLEIAVIPDEDLAKPVPWLRAGDDVFLGDSDGRITVRQAFFFHGP